ncbi:MAG: alpha/beta hydrolase [Ktedonobacteraceae bacterium]|nr:alpha/beta hydrolase [Ktedonobacteraceae bacterium]
MLEPRSSLIDADGIQLHYLEWDAEQLIQTQTSTFELPPQDDAIPLVMLHGLGATADTWRLVAEHLYQRRIVVAFDMRGHGQSDQPASGYDLVTIAEDIVHAMAALGFGKVALVGHGWGGRVALVLAARHPALVSHLILVDSLFVEPRHWPGMVRKRFINEQVPPRWFTSRTAYLEAMRNEMCTFWSPQVQCIVLTYIRELPDGRVEEHLHADIQRRIRTSLWEDRALSYYSKVTCPVLLVPAATEPKSGEELPERLERAEDFASAKGHMALQVSRIIRRCSVLWMPATSHEIQLQRPALLAQAIARFVAVSDECGLKGID